MNDAWFDGNIAGGIIGTALGLAGALVGTLHGVFGPRGKWKSVVYGVHFGAMILCLGLAIAGVIAFVRHQPRDVYYALGYPGCLGLLILGAVTPQLRRTYRQAELRKSVAQDL